MIKALLFDMDGLLTNTEPLHYKAYREAFKIKDFNLLESDFQRIWTLKGEGCAGVIKEFNLNLNENEMRNLKKDIYLDIVSKEAKLMPGAMEILNKVKNDFRLALVSASHDYSIRKIFEIFKFDGFFDVVLTCEDVKNIKPNPEAFLKAAKMLNVNPKECVVFDDAEKGIIAAKNAGMKCVAIPNSYSRNGDFSKANLILNSLNDVDVEILKKW